MFYSDIDNKKTEKNKVLESPQSRGVYLSVVIPAYNEENRITKTLNAVREYLSQQSHTYEVLVVNDGSRDNTSAVVSDFAKNMPSLRLLDNEQNHGKGWVVRQGMLEAKGDIRLFMDADNSTSVDQIEGFLPYFDEGYDVVIGSIAAKGSVIVQGGGEPFWRVILGKLGNLWIRIFAVPGIHDTQRGFKAFTARAVVNIFPKLQILGWGMDIEILALALKYKFKIKEMPIVWDNDPNSKVNFWAYPQVLMQTLEVWFNMLTGVYK